MRRPPIAALLLLVAAAALTGCEFGLSAGEEAVPSDEVAKQAKSSLNEVAEEEGFPPITEIECPDDLDDEEGATTRCDVVVDGEELEVVATVTEVDGDRVDMNFEIVEPGEAGQES